MLQQISLTHTNMASRGNAVHLLEALCQRVMPRCGLVLAILAVADRKRTAIGQTLQRHMFARWALLDV